MGQIMNSMKEKIDSKIYKKSRKNFIKNIIGKYGKILEEEDKITLYATQELVDKNSKNYYYELYCDGFNTHYEKSKKMIEKLKLNKQVYYIFDGIIFNKPIKLSNMFAKIIFRNCTFTNGLGIFFASSITLEKNTYFNWTDFYLYGDSFLSGKIDELIIKEEQFINSDNQKYYETNKFGMNIDTQKLSIINSTIQAENSGQINIEAKEIQMNNSIMEGPEIYIIADNIISKKSIIKSNNGVMIENKNKDFSGIVQAPTYILNGRIIPNHNQQVSTSKEKLQIERQKLIQILRNLKDYCQQTNTELMNQIQVKINNQPIQKILSPNKRNHQ